MQALSKRNNPKPSVFVYGIAAVAAGIVNVAWGDFATGWQPITALTASGVVPFRVAFAYSTAVWMVLGGCAILWPRTARAGALALAAVYCLFAAFWLMRLYWVYRLFGLQFSVLTGVLAGAGEQLVLVAAATIVYIACAPRNSSWLPAANLTARAVFGLCVVVFGLAHFGNLANVAGDVPKWIPLGGRFWTALTGTAFVLAGIAILSGVLDVLGSRLLALMLFAFSALVWLPTLVAAPHDHLAWGGNAYNLAAAAAAWIFADKISGALCATPILRSDRPAVDPRTGRSA